MNGPGDQIVHCHERTAWDIVGCKGPGAAGFTKACSWTVNIMHTSDKTAANCQSQRRIGCRQPPTLQPRSRRTRRPLPWRRSALARCTCHRTRACTSCTCAQLGHMTDTRASRRHPHLPHLLLLRRLPAPHSGGLARAKATFQGHSQTLRGQQHPSSIGSNQKGTCCRCVWFRSARRPR